MTTQIVPPRARAKTAPVARGAVSLPYLVAGLALLGAAVTVAARHETGTWSVLLFVLLPDAALLLGLGQSHEPGQLPRRAVPAYNLTHHPLVPLVLLAAAVPGLVGAWWLVGGLAWAAHIAIDRGVGYGPRTRDGWQRG